MKFRNAVLLAVALIGAVGGGSAVLQAEGQEGEGSRRDTSIVEETGQELFQIDVSVRRTRRSPEGEIPRFALTDFDLVVFGRPTPIRYLDYVCTSAPGENRIADDDSRDAQEVSPEISATGDAADATASATPRARATYLFYLELSHLTMTGLNNTLDMLEEMVPQLVRDGNRGVLVSSGNTVVSSDVSDDPAVLLATLTQVRKDPEQWTSYAYAQGEAFRHQEVRQALARGTHIGVNVARQFQLEEQQMTNNRLRRFSAVLGMLADLDAPKAVLYFSDIVRSNAGEHYLNAVGAGVLGTTDPEDTASMMRGELTAQYAVDAVMKEAGAQGARLYTVQAQGLQHSTQTRANLDAESTMTSFALETGGETFRGGTDPRDLKRIYDRIAADLGCVYLVSFDPGDFPRDQPLPVRVRFDPESERAMEFARLYDIRARGQIVIQSPAARHESVLLAAHAANSAVESTPGRTVLIPLAYDRGKFVALAQLAVANPDLPEGIRTETTWDVGMSHVVDGKVVEDVSSRIEVEDARAPVVLETAWSFRPGESEIVSVGYEQRFGQLVTDDLEPEWPNPDLFRFTVTPTALVQPVDGVFVRVEGQEQSSRRRGSLGVGDGSVFVDRPTYAITLVCRGKRYNDEVWIERDLAGDSTVAFAPVHWPHDGDRCTQIRDLIRPGQMGWGEFTYGIRVRDNPDGIGTPLAEGSREFAALPGGTDSDVVATE